MREENDWRLDIAQEPSFYEKFTWELKKWTQTRSNWDHDHCDFCGTEISNIINDEIQNIGWTNDDEYYWICETCFDDFKDLYQWKIRK